MYMEIPAAILELISGRILEEFLRYCIKYPDEFLENFKTNFKRNQQLILRKFQE